MRHINMHDIHLADQVHKLIIEQAQKNKLKNVQKVAIELGEYMEHGSDITADNLEYNLKMLATGTPAEGAQVTVTKVQGDNYWKLISISGDEE